MEYLTKGLFLQALSDYTKLENKIEDENEQYKRLMYLRYEKIKSPLDYDVVGYKDGEPVRKIKGHRAVTESEISSNREKLEKQMEKCLNRMGELKNELRKVDKDLSRIAEPLKSILELKYKGRKTLKDLCEKYPGIALSEGGMHKFIDKSLDKYYE